MAKLSTKPPSGMRDFLPEDLVRRRYVMQVIASVYESHGFVGIETPTIENLSTLLGKYGEEGDQLLYRVLKRRDALYRVVDQAASEQRPAKESDLADQGLRYDLTVPLARVVAQYRDLPRFFKRYQMQPVWRADRPGRGRFREFYQCDVDVVGTKSLVAEAEVCSAVCTVLRKLGFTDFVVHLNHRALLSSMVRVSEIPPEFESSALVAVDKLDKIGIEGVQKELESRGISQESAQKLLAFMQEGEARSNAEQIEDLKDRVDDPGREALEAMAELLDCVAHTSAAEHLRISPTLARGLSYYTGCIFEISVKDLAGSLGGGGRYDGLVGMFGGQAVPAVGFSLGLERILVVMQEREMYPELSTACDLMLCWMDVPKAQLLNYAQELRNQGLRVEVYPEAAKLKKQLQYATSKGVESRFAAILGQDELAEKKICIKDLARGEQATLALSEVAEHLAKLRAPG